MSPGQYVKYTIDVAELMRTHHEWLMKAFVLVIGGYPFANAQATTDDA